MDVLTAAWTAAGCPLPADPSTGGRCSRCGQCSAELVPTRAVISKVFTALDGWRDVTGPGLCAVCVWGYRTPALRTAAHRIINAPPCSAPTMRQLTPALLVEALSRPLSASEALVVPLRPGRKHLVPTAVWGRVTTDDAVLPWTGGDCARLAAMRRMRSVGFGSRMLREAAPPWSVLHRLPRTWWDIIAADWAVLEPWRTRRPWFDLAVRATCTPAEAAA